MANPESLDITPNAPTIFLASRGCLALLIQCNTIRELTETRWAENQTASFKLWAESIGAFAHGSASADFVLQTSKNMVSAVLGLLELLQVAIEQTIKMYRTHAPEARPQTHQQAKHELAVDQDVEGGEEAVTEPGVLNPIQHDLAFGIGEAANQQSLTETTSIGEGEADTDDDSLLSSSSRPDHEVEDVLCRLHQLLIVIRSSKRFHLGEQASGFVFKDSEVFRKHLEARVTEIFENEYPDAKVFIRTRLINANMKRRSQFEYAWEHAPQFAQAISRLGQRHEQMMISTGGVADTDVQDVEGPADTSSTLSLGLKRDASLEAKSESISTRKSTVYRVTEKQSESRTESTQSEKSPVGGKIVWPAPPQPPDVDPRLPTYPCPFCQIPLPIDHCIGKGSEEKWRQHVKSDIQPYVCLFEDCPSSLRLYSRRDEWINHMRYTHGETRYICHAAGHDSLSFGDLKDYRVHFEQDHPATLSQIEWSALVGRSIIKIRLQPIFRRCPICAVPGKESKSGRSFPDENSLLSHIEEHLQSIALIALPSVASTVPLSTPSTATPSASVTTSRIKKPSWMHQVRELFKEHYSISATADSEDGGHRFIGEHHLRHIWNKVLKDHNPDLATVQAPSLQESKTGRLLQVASILVAIGWTHWEKFSTTFVVANVDTSDAQLPFTRSLLREIFSPKSPFVELFFICQYRFLPPYIIEGRNIKTTSMHRLPFTSETLLGGFERGDPRRVTKVEVAPGYLKSINYPNTGVYSLARKRVQDAKILRNAELVKETVRKKLSKYSGIVEHFCTMVVDNDLSFLLEFADGGDLYGRLHHRDGVSLINTHSRDVRSSMRVSEGTELQYFAICEMANLVNALSFLHSSFSVKERRYSVDLKPDNILVFFKSYTENCVGRWKIADFRISLIEDGISSFEKGGSEGKATNVALSTSDTKSSSIVPPRDENPYRPPEAEALWKGANKCVFDHKGSIWSLGCILCLVLAYIIADDGGVVQLEEKLSSRYSNGDDKSLCFYRFENDCPETSDWSDDSDNSIKQYARKDSTMAAARAKIFKDKYAMRYPRVKRRIKLWLREVKDNFEHYWVSDLARVIRRCLRIRPSERPNVDVLEAWLQKISSNIQATLDGNQPISIFRDFKPTRSGNRPSPKLSGNFPIPPGSKPEPFSTFGPTNPGPQRLPGLEPLVASSPAAEGRAFDIWHPINPRHGRTDSQDYRSSSRFPFDYSSYRASHKPPVMMSRSASLPGQVAPSAALISAYQPKFENIFPEELTDLAICPISARIVGLGRLRTYLAEPLGASVNELHYAVSMLSRRVWTSAVIRGPCVLLYDSATGATSTRVLKLADQTISSSFTSFGTKFQFHDPLLLTFSLSAEGRIAFMDSTRSFIVHEKEESGEIFCLVRFNLEDDLLLACGVRSIFMWKITEGDDWLSSPRRYRYPWDLPSGFKESQIVHFNRRKAFLFYNSVSAEAFIIEYSMDRYSKETSRFEMLCGVIAPNDENLYYVRQAWDRKKNRISLKLYRRTIFPRILGEEQHCADLGLKFAKSTKVCMTIRRVGEDEALVVASSFGHTQILPLEDVIRSLGLKPGRVHEG